MEGAGVTVAVTPNLQPLTNNTLYTLVIMPLLTPAHATTLSQMMTNMPPGRTFWLALTSSTLSSHLQLTIYFPLLNQVRLAQCDDGGVMLTEIYQTGKSCGVLVAWAGRGGEQRVVRMGGWRWGTSTGVQELPPSYLSPLGDVAARHANLTGLHLRCLTIQHPPLLIPEVVIGGKGALHLSGWMGAVWNEIRARTNFTYTCVYPTDGKWGTRNDGRWDGMVGEVVRGEADVIAAPLDYTLQRSMAIDFCFQFIMLGYKLVIARPNTNNAMWTNFTRELEVETWGALAAVLVIAALVLATTTTLSPRESSRCSIADASLLTFGSLCGQSMFLNVNSASSRVVVLVLFYATTLFTVYYTCFLISNLTVSSATPPFTTLQEAHQAGKYTLGYESRKGLYHDVWRDMVTPVYHSLGLTSEAGLRQLLTTNNHIYIIDELLFKAEFSHDCSYLLLPNTYIRVPSAFAVAKGSPLRSILNYHLTKLRETGVVGRYAFTRLSKSGNCYDTSRSLQPATLSNVMTAFLQLGVASFLALMMVAVEKGWWHWGQRRRTNRTVYDSTSELREERYNAMNNYTTDG
ncbi:hypothetical protein Pcinc_039248 [Petrolisthes cinctipes]|uniref:Ionotropic glutamate receptor C-terminal domain-containing protein n=1 Tax=Petrolisthes cinctipes TaxID=88211 RepID=A0AAE1BP05_PETCI|nr:hypothetical protein Pcinc_039248 [Petrolisthes cinctipes]